MLESMANEFFLDLLEYLSTAHSIRAFRDLNSRFDDLLWQHFQLYGLDFQSISENDFERICEHLPSITHRIPSLLLSADDETPPHVELFCSNSLSLNRFINLRSLSYFNIRQNTIINRMMLEWSSLPQLTRLMFVNCSFDKDHLDLLRMMNCIWSLSKLKYCHLDFYGSIGFDLCNIMVMSSSLKYLWLKHCFKRNEFIHLCKQTPRLRSLGGCSISFRDGFSLISPLPSITVFELSIDFKLSLDRAKNSLGKMPNLRQLRIDMRDRVLDGCQWEQIIGDCLPMLKIFQLRMIFKSDKWKCDTYIDEFVNSFRSDFWIKEHKWFIRCLVPNTYDRPISLYTVPYAFASFELNLYRDGSQIKSTCPNEERYRSYDRVHNLSYLSDLNSEYGLLSSSRVQFPNIHHLSVVFPIRNHFWSIFPRIDQLKTLTVLLTDGNDNEVISQIQSLLDKAPYLDSLSFQAWPCSTISIFKNTSASVRKLNFENLPDYHRYGSFNVEQCIELTQSSLGVQCEILSIRVCNRTSIIDLINQMPNLRVLNIRCVDDRLYKYPARCLMIRNDELLEWLRDCLPSTCTIARCVDNFIKNIRIWIR